MNCKPGDLAVVVSGFSQNVGGLVRVICADPTPADYRHWWVVEALSALAYALDADSDAIAGRLSPGDETHIADTDLRPIRDNDGMDQTLEWKSVPRLIQSPITA